MIRTDDEPAERAGQSELGDHPLAGLDIAEDEILPTGIGEGETAVLRGGQHRIRRFLDVDHHRAVGADRCERLRCIGLIRLDPVGKAHGYEFRRVAAVTQLAHRPLGNQRRRQ